MIAREWMAALPKAEKFKTDLIPFMHAGKGIFVKYELYNSLNNTIHVYMFKEQGFVQLVENAAFSSRGYAFDSHVRAQILLSTSYLSVKLYVALNSSKYP